MDVVGTKRRTSGGERDFERVQVPTFIDRPKTTSTKTRAPDDIFILPLAPRANGVNSEMKEDMDEVRFRCMIDTSKRVVITYRNDVKVHFEPESLKRARECASEWGWELANVSGPESGVRTIGR